MGFVPRTGPTRAYFWSFLIAPTLNPTPRSMSIFRPSNAFANTLLAAAHFLEFVAVHIFHLETQSGMGARWETQNLVFLPGCLKGHNLTQRQQSTQLFYPS